jgi:hypothetical protein
MYCWDWDKFLENSFRFLENIDLGFLICFSDWLNKYWYTLNTNYCKGAIMLILSCLT